MYQLSFHPYAATVVFFICLLAALKFNNYLLNLQKDQDAGTIRRRPTPPQVQPTQKMVVVALAIFLTLIFTLTAYAIYMHKSY